MLFSWPGSPTSVTRDDGLDVPTDQSAAPAERLCEAALHTGGVAGPATLASVTEQLNLRPVERVVRRLVDNGVDPAEVAWRLRRSPRSVKQILELSTRARTVAQPAPPQVLRPLERRILAWRAEGASYAEIGSRFRRSPAFVRQVEEIASVKMLRARS